MDVGIVADADDGQCSIVEAVYNANTNSQRYASAGECAAGDDNNDTIELPDESSFELTTPISNTYAGDRGLPEITTEVTINGNGATVRRGDAAPNFGLVSVGFGGNLTLNGLALANGVATRGGAMQIFGTGRVTLNQSTVSGNTASELGGGIRGSSGVTVNNSTIAANTAYEGGGGIHTGGSVTVSNSTITANTAGSGGGIRSDGYLRVVSSTISSNSATFHGGGIWSYRYLYVGAGSVIEGNVANGDGGGIASNAYDYVQPAVIVDSRLRSNTAGRRGGGFSLVVGSRYSSTAVKSSTFADNVAQNGGGVSGTFGLFVENSTFSGNTATSHGGGIQHSEGFYGYQSLGVNNSTFTNNAGLAGGDDLHMVASERYPALVNSILGSDAGNLNCQMVGGSLAFNINNLIRDGGGHEDGCSAGATGLITGDPLLGRLADNGGFTETHELLAGSPAIDAGDAASCETTDQRGARRDSAACDIGAFEVTDEVFLIFADGFE